jgi:hypothetical protein
VSPSLDKSIRRAIQDFSSPLPITLPERVEPHRLLAARANGLQGLPTRELDVALNNLFGLLLFDEIKSFFQFNDSE